MPFKFIKSEFGKGTLFFLISLNFFNILNFLFSVFMGRLLAPAEYGTLIALMSLVYLYGIPSEAIQNLVSRHTSKFNVEKKEGKTKYLMKRFFKTGTIFSLIIFFILLIVSVYLAKKWEINYFLLAMTHLLIFSGFYGPITRGVLQGKKRFGSYSFSLILEGFSKLVLALALVFLGFGVFGAMNAVLISVFFGILISFYYCRDVLSSKTEKSDLSNIQATPYFITMLCLMVFLSLDMLLAKWFFDPVLAGKYAVLSVMGKIIFLGTNGIGKAMFPLSSEKKDRNEKTSGILIKSFLLTLILSGIGVVFYSFFPEEIIALLYGNIYSEISPYLVYSGLSFAFLALSNVLLLYGLSTERIKKGYSLLLLILLQFSILSLMNSSLLLFLKGLLISNIIIFIVCYSLAKRK
jgi:O-antigen/teichoic acid export membrane protein